ncbi:KCU-star family selenoprotein [Campylobacter sp. US33a]|uniref:KCU-star family selenoprotein n=1 Tax=Campylobacter sp. CCS1377 TaxID=3158229 RepID=A0AAU7E4P0_9BACT|nr:KCU-star family selenoprotein [Campylobacter sp. US33a]MCW1360722.1 KCU-star family selenoprotein [Campylobacter jejuni]TEY04088.1 putative selenoprotein [Campylobacter sp. US33a]
MIKRLKQWYEKSERFFHPLIGLASYDKYLEHMKKHHPNEVVKSRGEFFKEYLEKKYNSGGFKKCC